MNNARGDVPGGKIDEILSLNGLYPKYIINTHGHPDRCGDNHYFRRKYKEIIIGASRVEKFYMENPEYHAVVLNLAGSLTDFDIGRPNQIDLLLESGTYRIDGKEIEIIPFRGHSFGQIGRITPERVCFLGDALFSESLIKQFFLLYLFDIEKSLRTMIRLKDVDAEFFVLGHNDRVLNKVEFAELCDVNVRNIERIKEQILALLERPAIREGILYDIVIKNNIDLALKEYSIIFFILTVF